MFITITGIDGCGKTLQVDMLQAWLKRNGRPSIVTKAYDDMAKLACRPVTVTFLVGIFRNFSGFFRKTAPAEFPIPQECQATGPVFSYSKPMKDVRSGI